MTQIKSTRAFRTISEAGEELDLQPHVLRFWESKFPQIQPMKRSGGRRFYRPEDIEFLRGIKVLLHREKHPIKDVQKLIRIRGHQSVIELGRSVERASRPKDIKETNLVPKRIKPVVKVPQPEAAEVKQQADEDMVPRPVEDRKKSGEDSIIRRMVPFGKSSREKVETPQPSEPDPVMSEPITRILDVEAFEDDSDDMRIPEFEPTAKSDDQSREEDIAESIADEEPVVEPVIEEQVEPEIEPEPEPEPEPDPGISAVDKENLETALSKLKSLRSRWEKYQS